MILQLESRGNAVEVLLVTADALYANLRGGKIYLAHCSLLIDACSRSFSLRFSLISLGKYNSMKLCKV